MKQMSETFSQHWVEKILAFAETQHIAKDVVATMKDSVALAATPKRVKTSRCRLGRVCK